MNILFYVFFEEEKKQGFKQRKNGCKSQKEREKFYREWLLRL